MPNYADAIVDVLLQRGPKSMQRKSGDFKSSSCKLKLYFSKAYLDNKLTILLYNKSII